jgi:hypothetical protein
VIGSQKKSCCNIFSHRSQTLNSVLVLKCVIRCQCLLVARLSPVRQASGSSSVVSLVRELMWQVMEWRSGASNLWSGQRSELSVQVQASCNSRSRITRPTWRCAHLHHPGSS